MHRVLKALSLSLILLSGGVAAATPAPAKPLVIGETFSIDSAVLGETRRINVYFPYDYTPASQTRLPVLYMPDGGLMEDFLHVAGLTQVLIGNGGMRPFLLVGIENTERRRDLTGPTNDPEDRKIAPRVGGSGNFRDFIRTELKPQIRARYPTTDESAVIGESLAGLFVVETFLREPGLFDGYIAIDPSLWWNRSALLKDAEARLAAEPRDGKTLFLATSGQAEIAADARTLQRMLEAAGVSGGHVSLPEESHATVYHPAALIALRRMLAAPKQPD